jgi:hypothetical protein
MNEIKNHPEEQKPKASKLGIVSLSFCILCLLILPFKATIYRPWWTHVLGLHIAGPIAIAGLAAGVAALIKVKKARGTLKSNVLVISGIVLTSLISGAWFLEITISRSHAYRIECLSNLSRFGRAMLIYSNEKGQYPEPNQWCDLLLKDGEISIENLICSDIVIYSPFFAVRFIWPLPKKGRCNYAINPGCNPNSPPDMVLLFDAKFGWNQYGGPEIMTFDNHEGKGCNILFNDASVQFVRPEKISALKWNAEESDGKSIE